MSESKCVFVQLGVFVTSGGPTFTLYCLEMMLFAPSLCTLCRTISHRSLCSEKYHDLVSWLCVWKSTFNKFFQWLGLCTVTAEGSG